MAEPLYASLAGVTVATAAARLGLRAGARGSWGPCPCCGADRRGSEDRRAPLGVSRDGRGWRCHRCGQAGDVAALVLALATGGGASGADGWGRARALAEGVGLLAPAGAVVSPVRVVVPRVLEAPPAPPAVAAPRDVALAWSVSGPVHHDPEVAAWLRSRALDPDAVALLDVARAYPDPERRAELLRLAALPPARATTEDGLARLAGVPRWAACGARPWSDGWRLVLPTCGPDGAMVGLRARWVRPDPPRAKEIGGTGVAAGPAVYADPVGRWLLARGPEAEAGELAGGIAVNPWRWRWSGAVVVCEGGPDFLTLATGPARAEVGKATAALLGVWSGGWSPAVGGRLPPGCTVRLATDPDAAGRAYAAKIRETLPAGCRVEVLT